MSKNGLPVWTATGIDRIPKGRHRALPTPTIPTDGREDALASFEMERVRRGGSYANPRVNARCVPRQSYLPDYRLYESGMRLAQSRLGERDSDMNLPKLWYDLRSSEDTKIRRRDSIRRRRNRFIKDKGDRMRKLIRLCLIGAIATLALEVEFVPEAAAAPLVQEDWNSVIYVPLALEDAGESDFAPLRPAPSTTPTDPSGTPTISATPSVSPGASATLEPTLAPSPTPTLIPPSIRIDGDWVETDHYRLFSPSERVDKDALGRMMEQYYAYTTDYFGAEPTSDLPLIGKIFADRESYVAGLVEDGFSASAGGSGGYYHPRTKTFYLFVQPTQHYTRMLTMHEATHQMQDLAGDCSYPTWWSEGEAEHLGMHSWDGSQLESTLHPLVTLEDYPKQALKRFEERGKAFQPIVTDRSGWNYREAWALVSFLREEHPEDFDTLRTAYCSGEASVEAWTDVFGPPVGTDLTIEYELLAWRESGKPGGRSGILSSPGDRAGSMASRLEPTLSR